MDKGDALQMFSNIKAKIKKVALNMSDIEIKVEEATSNEPWGPHGTAMSEIAQAAYDWEQYRQIMGVIGRRLQSTGDNWRHVYKSLILLDYLLKHGPTRIIQELDSSLSVIERFHRFEYVDENGKDCGINVRHRAKELSSLVRDRERVDAERAKAKALKSKYGGMSREEASYGGGGFGSSGGGGGSGRSYNSNRHYDDFDASLDRASRRSEVSTSGGRMEGFGSDSYRGGGGGGSRGGGYGRKHTYDDDDDLGGGGGYDAWPSEGGRERGGRGGGGYDDDGYDDHRGGGGGSRRAPPSLDDFEQGGGTGGTGKKGGEDPVEETQRRIRDLKVKGLVDDTDETTSRSRAAKPVAGPPSATGAPRTKRLSDMKVNPQIAATLGGLALPTASTTTTPASSHAAATGQAVAGGVRGGDLLGDLAAPAVAPSQGDLLVGGGGGGGGGEWNAFGDAGSGGAAADTGDVWDAFTTQRTTPTTNTTQPGPGLLAAAATPTPPAATPTPPAANTTTAGGEFDAFVGVAPPAAGGNSNPLTDLLGGDVQSSTTTPPLTTTTTMGALDEDFFSLGNTSGATTTPLANPTPMIKMGVQMPVGLNVPVAGALPTGAPVGGPLPAGFQGVMLPPGAVVSPGGVPGMMPGMVAVQMPPRWTPAAGVGGMPVMGVGGGMPGGMAPLTSTPSGMTPTLASSTSGPANPDDPMRPGHQRGPSHGRHDPFDDIFK